MKVCLHLEGTTVLAEDRGLQSIEPISTLGGIHISEVDNLHPSLSLILNGKQTATMVLALTGKNWICSYPAAMSPTMPGRSAAFFPIQATRRANASSRIGPIHARTKSKACSQWAYLQDDISVRRERKIRGADNPHRPFHHSSKKASGQRIPF